MLKKFLQDKRWIVVLFLLIYFSILLMSPDHQAAWEMLGVPSMEDTFHDLRVITSGLDCLRNGSDPLVEGHCKPSFFDFKRQYTVWYVWNYPKVWYLFQFFGIGERHTDLLGIILAILFFVCVLAMMKKVNGLEALFYGVLLCSPPVMLAIERGNNDLIIFLLLFLTLFVIKRHSSIRFLGYAIIVFSGFLKLYPIAAMPVAVREKTRQFWKIFIAGIIPFAVYVFFFSKEFLLVAQTAPRPSCDYGNCYATGAFVYVDCLWKIFFRWFSPDSDYLHWIVIVLLVLAIIFLMILVRKGQAGSDLIPCGSHIDAFRMGSLIYSATFLFGNNYEYRLIFLLFTLPQIFVWCRRGHSLRKISFGALGAIAIICTYHIPSVSMIKNVIRLSFFYSLTIKEAASWFLFGYFVYVLMVTLPKGLKTKLFFIRTKKGL